MGILMLLLLVVIAFAVAGDALVSLAVLLATVLGIALGMGALVYVLGSIIEQIGWPGILALAVIVAGYVWWHRNRIESRDSR